MAAGGVQSVRFPAPARTILVLPDLQSKLEGKVGLMHQDGD